MKKRTVWFDGTDGMQIGESIFWQRTFLLMRKTFCVQAATYLEFLVRILNVAHSKIS